MPIRLPTAGAIRPHEERKHRKGTMPFTADRPGYGTWVQVLRKPRYEAEVSVNGLIYTDFGAVNDDDVPM